MGNTLLQSLRESVLDESEALAGLLRKCLMLGAQTGSDSLRQWARYEVSGYDPSVEVPTYRLLITPPITVDQTSGNRWATGIKYDRFQLPPKVRQYVPETLPLRQPVEELEELAATKTISFANASLSYARTVWNGELGMFQEILGMSYTMSGSVISGVLGQIRTQLVDVVAELTADTPLAELPRKDVVDAAFARIGTQYNTTIHTASGPVAIGSKAQARAEGLSVEDAMTLLAAVRDAAAQVTGEDTSELLQAVEDLQAELQLTSPDTGEVVRRAGKLKAAAERVGIPALSAAVGGAVNAFSNLAMNGAFG